MKYTLKQILNKIWLIVKITTEPYTYRNIKNWTSAEHNDSYHISNKQILTKTQKLGRIDRVRTVKNALKLNENVMQNYFSIGY